MIENNNNINKNPQQAGKPVDVSSDYVSNYIKIVLDSFSGINFRNLTLENYRDICTGFRESGRDTKIEEYLLQMGVKILIHSSDPKNKGYILEFNGKIYLEIFNFLAPKAEYLSTSKYRYVRRLKKDDICFIVVFFDGKYLILKDSEIVPKGNELDYIRIINNPTHGLDIVNTITMEIFSLGAKTIKVNKNGIIRIFFDKITYIDYDGMNFSEIQKIGDTYPYFGDRNIKIMDIPLQ